MTDETPSTSPAPRHQPSEQGPARAASAPPRRTRHPWLIAFGALVLLIVVAITAFGAWLASPAALAYVIAEIGRRTDGAVVVRDAKGSLLSSITAAEITYVDPEKRVSAHDVRLRWSPFALLGRELHVDELAAGALDVELGKGGESKLPESLALPLLVVVDRATVGELRLRSGEAQWPIKDIRFAYRGGADAHRLSDIGLAAEQGTLTGNFEIAASKPFALKGQFALVGTPELKSPRADVTATGRLDHIELNGSGRVVDASVTAKVILEPIDKVPLKNLALSVRDLDIRAFGSNLPATSLTIDLNGAPAPDAILVGSFDAENRAAGPIDRDRIPVRALKGDFRLTSDVLQTRNLRGIVGDAARVTGTAVFPLDNGKPDVVARSDWGLQVKDLNLAAIHTRLIATRLSGDIKAALEGKVQHVEAHITQQDMALDAKARIAGTTVDLERFDVRARGGELAGRGRFDWSGARTFQVNATAHALDPSRFGDFPPAQLDGTVVATGHLEPGWGVQGDLALAPTSRFRGTGLSGRVAGAFTRDRIQDVVADLRVASATLHADGALGRAGDRMRFAIDTPRVQDLATIADGAIPADVKGAVQASGTLTGAFNGLGIEVDAHGANLAYGADSAARVDLRASIAPGSGYTAAALRTRPVNIDAHATNVTWNERVFSRVDANAAGSLAQHDVRLAVKDSDVDVTLVAGGGLAPMTSWSAQALAWSGAISQLENRGQYAVRLAAPAQVEASPARVAVRNAHIALPEGALNVAAFEWSAGRITTRGDFSGLPVSALVRIAGAELPVRTTLVLGGDWNIAASPRLNGTINIRREGGDVYADTTGTLDAGELSLGITDLSLAATIVDDAINARAALKALRLGEVTANVGVGRVAGAPAGRIAANGPLSGSVRAELGSLRPLQMLLGTTAIVDGDVRADLALAGTVSDPRATGTIDATKLRVDAPQYGLFWRDGVLRAQADNNVIRIDEFSVAGGDGRFSISGTVPFAALGRRGGEDRAAHLTWQAKDFRATNRPDLRLVTTGDGTVGVAHGRIALRGNLRINEGHVEWRDTRGARLGDDVVVVGRPRPAPARKFEDLPLDLDLNVDLGTRFTIAGSGLATTLEGQARFTTTAAGTLTARGTLRTSHGTYAAFGQQLSIERGTLIFAGPIDNPSLDIVALRKNLPVEAGVELTGTVRLPNVRLTSNPPVPEGEKLSWLVLGQGLERTSGTDVAALQTAAAALFGSTGPSFGTRIAQRIGLDDLSIRSASGATGGASGSGLDTRVLAFSKRLTDRLYLVYEAGLTAANNALRIEYALSRSFTLRAQAGQVSRLGVYFLRAYR